MQQIIQLRILTSLKLVTAFLFCICSETNAYAQTTYPAATLISGRVVDAKSNAPIPGTTLIKKNSQVSFITGDDGNFTMRLSGNEDTLIIRHLGYQTKQIAINNQTATPLIISLVEASAQLGEVVVSTGYQNIPKERATGSFDFIDNKLLNRSESPDILSRLQGVTSALTFNKSTLLTGLKNNQSTIAIRGRSTIYANPNPLIIVDNFPYDGDLSTINPNDIENITILKDAAAASIWGAYSGNGVIVITTKRGNYDQPLKVSFNTNVTIGDKPNIFYTPSISPKDYIDAEQYLFSRGYYKSRETNWTHPALSPVVEILIQQRDGAISDAQAEAKLYALGNQDIRNDELKYFFRNSVNQQYAINLSGGSVNQRYYFGVGYDKDISDINGNNNNRITINASNTYSLLKKKIELTTSIVYTQEAVQANGMTSLPVAYPYLKLADSLGNPLPIPYEYRTNYIDTTGGGKLLDWHYYPLEELRDGERNNSTELTDYHLDFRLKYNILKGLDANLNYQFNRGLSDNNNLQSQQTFYTRDLINRFSEINYQTGDVIRPVPLGGILDISNKEYRSDNARGQINYSYNWSNSQNITALAGAEIRNITSSITSNREYGYDSDLKTSVPVDNVNYYPLYNSFFSSQIFANNSNIITTNHFLSYFANAAYSYEDKYIFSGSARKDASNLFGVKTNQKWVPLWSIGGSWDISRENFYSSKWLPYLKLKVSDGYNGNVDNTLSSSITASGSALNIFNTPYLSIENPPNPNLQWEKINIINIGLEFSSNGNIIGGSVEYYMKKGTDLIGTAPIDPSSGVASFKGNLASMKGNGIDVTLNTRNIDKSFKWTTTLLFNYSANKISKYSYDSNEFVSNLLNLNLNPIVGKPLYAIYGYKWAGLDAQTGDPQILLDGKVSKDYSGIYTSKNLNNLKFFGPANPRFYGGVLNEFSWKRFMLSFNITYKFGYYFRKPTIQYGDFLTPNKTPNDDFSKRWQKPGDEKATHVPSFAYPINSLRDFAYANSSILVEKGDHIRLQDIKISYKIGNPKSGHLFKNSVLYGYVNNIGIIWKASKTSYDPDYLFSLPDPLSVAIGLKTNLNL